MANSTSATTLVIISMRQPLLCCCTILLQVHGKDENTCHKCHEMCIISSQRSCEEKLTTVSKPVINIMTCSLGPLKTCVVMLSIPSAEFMNFGPIPPFSGILKTKKKIDQDTICLLWACGCQIAVIFCATVTTF